MADEKVRVEGVKETTDILKACGKVGAVIARHLKDGFQAQTDPIAILTEIATKPDVQAAIMEAKTGAEKAPAELKDLDALEGLDLGIASLEAGKEIVKELFKKE